MLKYFIFTVILLLAFLGTGWFLYQKGQKKPVVYKIIEPKVMDITKKSVATGSIVPQKEVNLKSQVQGIVELLYVEPGQQVKKGEKVAKVRLMPTPANINSAEANIEQLKIRLREAKKELERQKGIYNAQTDIGQAKVALENSEKELQRQRSIVSDGTDIAQATIALENSEKELARQRKIYDSETDIAATRIAVEDAEKEYARQQKIFNDDIEIEQAKIALADAEKEYARQQKIFNDGIEIEQAKIALADAQTELKRQQSLFDEGIISEQSLQQFKVSVETRQSALDQAQIETERKLNRYKIDLETRKSTLNQAKVEAERKLNRYKVDVESKRSQLKNAKEEADRRLNQYITDVESKKSALENAKIGSDRDLNRYVTDVESKKSALDNAKISASRQLAQYERDVELRQSELEAAQNSLRILREGAAQKSKDVSNVITSTLTGMVLEIPIEEGGYIIESNSFNQGTTIATVADMSELIFEGNIPESEVGKLKEGMPLEINIGALEEEKFKAQLTYIAPKGILEDGSIQFPIKAAIDVPDEVFIRAGYSANADIILNQKKQVLTVNERDVVFKKDSTYVEVESQKQEFEKRLIETGISDGINVEVVKGLQKGEKIKKQEQDI